jgi:hypothetical protein
MSTPETHGSWPASYTNIGVLPYGVRKVAFTNVLPVIVDENPGRQKNFVAAKTDPKPVCSVKFENVYSMDMTSWSKNEHVCQECKTFVKARTSIKVLS